MLNTSPFVSLSKAFVFCYIYVSFNFVTYFVCLSGKQCWALRELGYSAHCLIYVQILEINTSSIFFKHCIYLFLERGREAEGEGEKYQCVVAFHVSLTGDLDLNPGMCPDWKSNLQPFGSQASAQSTEPHQPGLIPQIF